MKHIMEHYGPAILAGVTFTALGVIVIALCTGDGFVATEFQKAMSNFFSEMNAL